MESFSDDFGEKLILSFSLKSCSKGFYYQISIKTNDNFETEEFQTGKILCSKEGDKIIFKEKMTIDFQFEKNQNIIITTHKISDYSNDIDFERKTTLASLVQSHMGTYERKISDDPNNPEIISIQLDKDKSKEEEKILFDYLKLGLKFSFYFAFDFSQKEQKIKDDFTDISIDILKKIINIYNPYFKDEHFANPFILGGSINKSNIYTIDKSLILGKKELLIEQYKNFLENKNIVSKNHVNLSPFIKKLINDMYESYQSNIYNILFIFLSGDINKKDQKETINQIIQSSYLPLNIVVIGIGNHNFSDMNKLFLDNVKSTEGMPKNKDNVIFASIKNKSAVDITLTGCLLELKTQIIDFFNMVKEPQGNEINLLSSYNIYQSVVKESQNKKEKDIIKENKEISNINNSNNQETKVCDDSININNNTNNIYQSGINQNDNFLNSSCPPVASSNESSCNNIDIKNNNNSNNKNIEGEKSENEKMKDKKYTNGESAFDSTKVSDIKVSSFSIFQ